MFCFKRKISYYLGHNDLSATQNHLMQSPPPPPPDAFMDALSVPPHNATFERSREAYEAALIAADKAHQIERKAMREEREALLHRMAFVESELLKMQARLEHAEAIHQRTILDTRQIVDDALRRKKREDNFGRKLLEHRTPDDTPALGLAFSRDSSVAVAQADGDISIWDQGRLAALLKGHTAAVNSVSFSPQGLRLVSGSKDKTISLYDASTSTRLESFNYHTGDVRQVQFSADGLFIASASWDKSAAVMDATTGQKVVSFLCRSTVEACSFNPDRKRLALAVDKSIEIWDVGSGQRVCTMVRFVVLFFGLVFVDHRSNRHL